MFCLSLPCACASRFNPTASAGFLLVSLFTMATAHGAAIYETSLDLTLTVDRDREDGVFSYASHSFSSFPGEKPPWRYVTNHESQTTGSGWVGIGPLQAEGGRIPRTGGNWMRLDAAGHAHAGPTPNSDALLTTWASGRSRIALVNLTGSYNSPHDAESIDVDLTLSADALLRAIAENNPHETDLANAKYLFRAVDGRTGDVLLEAHSDSLLASEGQSLSGGLAGFSQPFTVTLPGASGLYVDLEGYVYGSAYSYNQGDGTISGLEKKHAATVDELIRRAELDFPDPTIPLLGEWSPLMGDAKASGGGRLDDANGVGGEGEGSINGLNTLFIDETIIMPNRPIDVEISVEAPIGGSSIVAIDNSLFAPAGFYGHGFEMEIGTGVGEDFAPSDDLTLLALLGASSELLPTSSDGVLLLSDMDEAGRVASFHGDWRITPNSLLNLVYGVDVSDAADGVIDGMARFTLRQIVPGIAGDYNGDGVVNLFDHVMWSEGYTQRSLDPQLAAEVDGNGDGEANAADYTVWRDSATIGGVEALAAHAVPEPSGILGLLLVVTLLVSSNMACRSSYSQLQ